MTPREEDVLAACQAICRTLAEEALLRIGGDLTPDTGIQRRRWLTSEKEKLERLLAQLGE